MKKILFFLLTFALGFLFGELLRHKKMKQLQQLAAREMRREARYARDEQAWQAELAAMPFEERMEWELFEAALNTLCPYFVPQKPHLDPYIKSYTVFPQTIFSAKKQF